jgi:hypothetical protein
VSISAHVIPGTSPVREPVGRVNLSTLAVIASRLARSA